MSKKKKSKESKPEKKSLKQKNLIIILSVLLIISFVVIGLQLKSTSKKTSDYSVSAVDDNSLRRGEIRQTLSPTQFGDPFVAETYQIAKDIPQVLDSLKCYCFCDRPPFNHKSLLSCYVDTHAAG